MKWFAGSVILVFLGFALPAQAGELRQQPDQPLPPGLDLKDLSGNRHVLEDYRGRVVLINFWGTWCPPCLAEMPSMQRLKESMADRPFAILAVNVNQSKSAVWRFVKLLNVDFTVLLDNSGKVSKSWQIKIFPTSFLMDTDGRLRYSVRGALEWDGKEAMDAIERLMPDRAPHVAVDSNH